MQELLEREELAPKEEKPQYADWMRQLQKKVEQLNKEEKVEQRLRESN